MSEFNTQAETVIASGSLAEFIQSELSSKDQELAHHESNLYGIKAGNTALKDIIGGGETQASENVNDAKVRLKKVKNAKQALDQGDHNPAQQILETRITELKEAIKP